MTKDDDCGDPERKVVTVPLVAISAMLSPLAAKRSPAELKAMP